MERKKEDNYKKININIELLTVYQIVFHFIVENDGLKMNYSDYFLISFYTEWQYALAYMSDIDTYSNH